MSRQCKVCKQLDQLEAAVSKISDQERVILRLAAESIYFADSSDYKGALQSIMRQILGHDLDMGFSDITSEMMEAIDPDWKEKHDDH